MNFAVNLPLVILEEDELSLEGQSKILNWSYNHLLETVNRRKEEFKETGDPKIAKQIYSERGLRDLLPALKKEKPFLCSVHSVPLKNAALRLSESIRRYQDNRKKKKNEQGKVGWPKFRSAKKKFFSLLFDEYGNGYQIEQEASGKWFLLVSLGTNAEQKRMTLRIEILEMPKWLAQSILKAKKSYPEIRKELPIEERKKFHIRKLFPFTQLRIKREGKQWHAILSVERKEVARKEIQKIAVIDPNHKNLGYLVDSEGRGIEIANLPFVKPLDKRIDQLKQRRDLCNRKSVKVQREDGSVFYKSSRRWKFFQDKLEELSRTRREQIKSALYTIVNQLTQEYDLVGIGNYTPRGGGISTEMRRSMNNQSQIGKFKDITKWVCDREGKYYKVWDEWKTTKTCHQCQKETLQKLTPEIRSWECEHCHFRHIRDENAAQNGSRILTQWLKENQLPCSGHLDAKMKKQDFSKWNLGGLGVSTVAGFPSRGPENALNCSPKKLIRWVKSSHRSKSN